MLGEIIVTATPNEPTNGAPILFNPDICDGCNICVRVCLEDTFVKSNIKGQPPIMLYPEECWACGVCVADCPTEGAIIFNPPLQQRVRWKRKATGEHFRLRSKG